VEIQEENLEKILENKLIKHLMVMINDVSNEVDVSTKSCANLWKGSRSAVETSPQQDSVVEDAEREETFLSPLTE